MCFSCVNGNGVPVTVRVRFRANIGKFGTVFEVKGKFVSAAATGTVYTDFVSTTTTNRILQSKRLIYCKLSK